MTLELSRDDARRLALTAQGLIGRAFPLSASAASAASPARRRAAVRAVLERLGAVQLDTISVLARSHELVPYARVGAVGREAVDTAYWGTGEPGAAAASFEYWSHAACLLPADMWPWFAFRRRHFRRRGIRWHTVPQSALAGLRQQLREDGPLTTRDIGGAKTGGEWWDWSESKVGIEWLLDTGEVVCSRRVGWRRVYDLPERALNPDLLNRATVGSRTWSSADGVEGPDDEECVRHLIALSARALGIGTTADLLDVHRLTARYTGPVALAAAFTDLVDAGTITPVTVPGWRGAAYADSEVLATGAARGRHRTTLLSPFDSLVWHRARTERVFGFEHRLEAYVPAPQRQHGYFTMPVLHGGHLVARVDPKRERGHLAARTVTFETTRGTGNESGAVSSTAIDGTARALTEAARWVGLSEVELGTVRPASAHAPLRDSITAATSNAST